MNQSAQLFSRACSVIPGGVNSPVRAFRNVDGDPFFVQSAKGAYITDADGRQLIDYIGTWGPAILGHAPQPVLDAVHAAVDHFDGQASLIQLYQPMTCEEFIQ